MICRYLPEQYALDLVNKGELLFRPLSYYRAVEDPVRGDKNEGVCSMEIKETHSFSLKINGSHEMPIEMEQLNKCVINTDDIFISCFSLGENLYNKFTESCKVTIIDFDAFLKRLKESLKFIPNSGLFHREVTYKNRLTSDEAEDAEVSFIKGLRFKDEQEYRFAFAIKSGQIEGIDGVHYKGEVIENSLSPLSFVKTIALKAKMGNLEDIAKVEYKK